MDRLPTFLLCCALAAPSVAAPPAAELDGKQRAFLEAYCLECHNGEKQKGKVRLDDIGFTLDSVEKADLWQKVLNATNSGEMPPEEAKQPDDLAKAAFLEELSQTMVLARQVIGDAGRVAVLRRLNRREYANTLRDLLGVEAEVRSLPDDALSVGSQEGEYDTFGASLFLSSDQFEQYLALGRQAAREAVSAWERSLQPARQSQIVRTEVEEAARRQIAGLLNGYFLTGYRKAKEWEAAGADPEKAKDFGFPDAQEAKFRIRAYDEQGPYLGQYLALPKGDEGAWLMYAAANLHHSEKITLPEGAAPGRYRLRLRIGASTSDSVPAARRFLEMGIAHDAETFQVLQVFHITGSVPRPQLLEIPVELTPGGNRVFTFREKRYADDAADGFRHALAKAVNGVGLDPALWIDWVEWEGPLPEAPQAERWTRLFGRAEPPAEDDAETVKAMLRPFATRAFRGVAPEAEFLERLAALHAAERRAGKSILEALTAPMAVVLASPSFLYLSGPVPEGAGEVLSDQELASRLSYFLWSSAPDEALAASAASGNLRDPKELAAQVQRMIADPRSLAVASGFTHQWLDLDRLDFFRFDYQLFPDFDESTREAARQEVAETFRHLFTENLDARLLLKSDFVVVNGLLGQYYGLTEVHGEAFRKVSLPPDSPRGGLLGMAAILAMGSNGERTSPVERGAWVLRKLLHSPPPPAPPNVPQLSRLEGKAMPARERLLAHQEEPQCAQCHRKIDPIGFGLEHFDAAGRWRTEEHHYRKGWVINNGPPVGKVVAQSFPIEVAGAFYGGPSFQDTLELRDHIAARGDDFLRGLIENLYAYALGRRVSFADEATMERLTKAARTEGGLADIVQRIVALEEFRTR